MTNRRTLLKMGGALVAGASLNIGAGGLALAGEVGANDIDPITLVNPELRAAAIQIQKEEAKYPPLSDRGLPKIRATIDALDAPPLEGIPFTEQKVPGTGGNPDVKVYVINAKPGTSRPGIVFIHGGGFILGDAKSTVRDLQKLASTLDCCIVSVDYRLAPEVRYSGSIEDNYSGLHWMYTHATEIGVDPARIAVMGESAGGGHAALLAITARDRGEVPVIFQMLIYPMLDDRTGSTRQMPNYMGAYVWSAASNRFGWRSFLGQEPGGSSVPAGAVPARTVDLRGLPPAFIGVGSIDLFVDEDVDYARRLINTAVATELHVIPGAFHGFDHNPTASVSKQFNEMKLVALRRAFGISSPT